jgi:hypothetical protein
VQEAYTLLGADWRETESMAGEQSHLAAGDADGVQPHRNRGAYRALLPSGDAYWPELNAPSAPCASIPRCSRRPRSARPPRSDKDYEAVLRDRRGGRIPNTQGRNSELKKEELLRAIIDNVGKRGSAGQDLQNVISVAMLSEGWDAKNVTHIMGLRAFTSQLLCEQVIGRGLRRVSYDTEPVVCPDGKERMLFKAEYVNVFGVPLSVFEDVWVRGAMRRRRRETAPRVEAVQERAELEISWPNVLRVDVVVHSGPCVSIGRRCRCSSSIRPRSTSARTWLPPWAARPTSARRCPSTWRSCPKSSDCSACCSWRRARHLLKCGTASPAAANTSFSNWCDWSRSSSVRPARHPVAVPSGAAAQAHPVRALDRHHRPARGRSFPAGECRAAGTRVR